MALPAVGAKMLGWTVGEADAGLPNIITPPSLEKDRALILPQISPNTNPTPTLNGAPSGTTQLVNTGPNVVPVAPTAGTPWWRQSVDVLGRKVPVWAVGAAALAGLWLVTRKRGKR